MANFFAARLNRILALCALIHAKVSSSSSDTNACQNYAFDYKITKDLDNIEIATGRVYIILMEDNLVTVVKKLLQAKLIVGQQVEIISYNETPIKEIILIGITTISADFKMMGETAAKMILEKSTQHVAVPFYLTLRDSL
ncbi:substrate-binding domain-containing protein [Arachidicoccus ginsenosidivorans]